MKGYRLVPVELLDRALLSIMEQGFECDGLYELVHIQKQTPQPIFDEAKERELFEVRIHRIAVEKGYQYMAFLLKRDESGEYQTTWVDMAWLGWSERAQSRAKSVEVDHG